MKNFINKFRLFWYLDSDIRARIDEIGAGNPIEVLKRRKEKSSICPTNAPSEYCSKDCLEIKTKYRTDSGKIVLVTENLIGLNFEAPCDKYTLDVEIVEN